MKPTAGDFDWSLCRTFLAVLRTGSFAGAARALGQSHPTIRRHIRELETSFGAPLFSRAQDGVVPAPSAFALVHLAEEMEASAEKLIRAALGGQSASLRVAVDGMFASWLLPDVFSRFRHAVTACEIEVVRADDGTDLLRRQADVAISSVRPAQSSIVLSRIGDLRYGLFAHRRLLGGDAETVELQDLVRSRLLSVVSHRTTRERRLFAGLGEIGAMVGFEVPDESTLISAVRAGAGVGLLPVSLGARLPDVTATLSDLTITDEIWLSVHPDLREVASVRALLEAIRVVWRESGSPVDTASQAAAA